MSVLCMLRTPEKPEAHRVNGIGRQEVRGLRIEKTGERVPTLLLAVNHHEAELVGQPADGSRGQSQEGAEPLPVRLAEANHWVRGAGRAHVLAPLEAFDPRQWALQGGGGGVLLCCWWSM